MCRGPGSERKRLRLGTAVVACLWLFASVAQAQVQPVRDINPDIGSSRNYTDLLVASEDIVVFSADDGSTGPALWRTDGTSAGTTLVADLFGPSGFFPVPEKAIGVGALAYFLVTDALGSQLWRSDGSVAGSFRATTPVLISDVVDQWAGLVPYRGLLAFEYAGNLWLSDGLTTGTLLAPAQIQLSNLPIGSVDDALYLYGTFPGALGTYGLLHSDSSPAGTALVQADVAPFEPLAVNGRLYFVYGVPTTGAELYALDAGAASVRLVKDIYAGFPTSNPQHLTRVEDRVYFTATDATTGEELWVSDGSEAGTYRVKDIVPGFNSSSPRALTAVASSLYFAATTAATGTELWRTDGTDAGTAMVFDLNPGSSTGLTGASDGFASRGAIALVNGRVFFQGRTDNFGVGANLWLLEADGQTAMCLDYSALSLGALVPFNGQLLFTGTRQSDGLELYSADLLSLLGNTWCSHPESGIADDASLLRSAALLPDRGNVYAPVLNLDIGHANVGDLKIALRHRETGTSVLLLDRPGTGATPNGCASDLIDIQLSDGAAATANDNCTLTEQRLAYPRNASYRPVQSLSAFNGESLAGHWDLEVNDAVSGNAGTLHQWCLSWSGPMMFSDGFESL
ncbi:MAG: proprotein convertase P-domain-containing protein [Rhodanobacteraceae bacterium]|nr:proprotein convertase P-domain-containing protein [Rhodanobacteraceae bacterium]